MSNLIGLSLGRYHILEQLGEGGMAVVYKAYDTRLEADVAVKVIRTENILPSVMERALKRFEREAKALARLTHPNIVKVTDYGEYEGKPYLVMPYFPGGTLKEKTGKPTPWREAIQILLPIAEALGYAHSQKMIHRDVKPANILLTQSGQPMLTDFGIAKILDLEETLELTGTNAAIGTPEYMAPEQATAKNVDHRADIYSFGIVLYEMLIGRKPYVADTPMAILIMHAHDPLPSPKMYVPDLPDEVERILLKALAKKPEDRYQNMGEMVKAFENLQRDQGRQPALETMPKKEEKRTPKLASESKLPIRPSMAMIIFGLAALVLFAVFGLPPLMGKPEPTPVVTSTKNLKTFTPIPATKMLTLAPTSTLSPIELGEIVTQCGNDLCICNMHSDCTTIRVSETYSVMLGWSWSPDGSRIVFGGCEVPTSTTSCQTDLLITDREGNITKLVVGPNVWTHNPVWSPDGQWIAFHEACGVSLIRPDGTGKQAIMHSGEVGTCTEALAWSPDSQHIAWIGGVSGELDIRRIWSINIDGTDMKLLALSEDVQFARQIAWSPDGQSVAVMTETGQVYLIDVGCVGGATGCDESSRATLDKFPIHWMHNFYPQWAGEQAAQSPANELVAASTLYPTDVPASLFIPAISQGKKFTAAADGIYRFTIKDGAILNCPSGANPNDPQCGTWTAFLTIFKNREILWTPNPASWDFSIGKSEPSDTQEQASSIGVGSYTDIPLYNNEYVMIVANDCVNCYDDNLGGIQLAISIVGAIP